MTIFIYAVLNGMFSKHPPFSFELGMEYHNQQFLFFETTQTWNSQLNKLVWPQAVCVCVNVDATSYI